MRGPCEEIMAQSINSAGHLLKAGAVAPPKTPKWRELDHATVMPTGSAVILPTCTAFFTPSAASEVSSSSA